MNKWKLTIPGFFILLFLIKYIDFFYLYLPVRSFEIDGDSEPTIGSFVLFNYFFKVVFYLAKFLSVALILNAGIFLDSSKKQIVSFGRLILIAIVAEYVFLILGFVKIIDFTFFSTNYTEQDYLYYYPLSLYSLLEVNANASFAALYQVISVFEAAYIVVLAYGLWKLQYNDKTKALMIALYSYGSMLIVWVLITTHLKIW